MSKDKIDFDFTVKDLDQMVLDAARGETQQQNKAQRPNILEILKSKGRLKQGNKAGLAE